MRKFRFSELNGGRFAECVLRLVQYLDNPPYTPFGTPLQSDAIIKSAERNTLLHESLRFFIPRTARIILDIRNRRGVGHVGGDINPNLSDSLFIARSADWIVTEIIRLYNNCSIENAQKIADSINEVNLPIVADIDGFVRIQNASLDFRSKTLIIL